MNAANSKRCGLVGVSLAAALGGRSALADDLIPPPWARFGPGTTAQSWDFHAGSGGGAPDGGLSFNPWGTPVLTPSNPSNWLPTLFNRNDVWAVNDLDPLNFSIPNDGPFPNDVKDVWLQVTYQSTAALTFGIHLNSQFGPPTLIGSTITALADGWTHEATLWRFHGCPESETLTITPPVFGTVIFIDQVVMDTNCYVPGPGALGLGLVGMAVVARRRRR